MRENASPAVETGVGAGFADISRAADLAAGLHTPVLLGRCLDLLAPALEEAVAQGREPVMIDATLGMGGHAEGALSRFPELTLVGIDRDPQAVALASARLARFGGRFHAVQTTYDAVAQVAARFSTDGAGTVDAVLMDLGVSSLQLDEDGRGFSYSRPAPLDMRMDPTTGPSAQDLLDTWDAAQITHVLRAYGEERFAARIAAEVVRRRQAGAPVRSTRDLSDLVRSAVPAATRRTGGHPAKRTFQALRVAVNAELDVLQRALPRALDCLRVGGRLVVESYQSLEDRLVKRAIAAGTTSRAPQGLPLVPQAARPYLEALTHGAEKATQAEIDANPRSAPVRLRAAVRTRPACDAPASQPGQERCRYGDRGTQHGRRRPAASARSRSRHTGRS